MSKDYAELVHHFARGGQGVRFSTVLLFFLPHQIFANSFSLNDISPIYCKNVFLQNKMMPVHGKSCHCYKQI